MPADRRGTLRTPAHRTPFPDFTTVRSLSRQVTVSYGKIACIPCIYLSLGTNIVARINYVFSVRSVFPDVLDHQIHHQPTAYETFIRGPRIAHSEENSRRSAQSFGIVGGVHLSLLYCFVLSVCCMRGHSVNDMQHVDSGESLGSCFFLSFLPTRLFLCLIPVDAHMFYRKRALSCHRLRHEVEVVIDSLL